MKDGDVPFTLFRPSCFDMLSLGAAKSSFVTGRYSSSMFTIGTLRLGGYGNYPSTHDY